MELTQTESETAPLGFDSVTTIQPGETRTLTSHPSTAFRPTRLAMSSHVAPYFELNDIKVGSSSQLVSSNPIPGATFAESAYGVRLAMDTAQPNQEISLVVTNVDDEPRRCMALLIGAVK